MTGPLMYLCHAQARGEGLSLETFGFVKASMIRSAGLWLSAGALREASDHSTTSHVNDSPRMLRSCLLANLPISAMCFIIDSNLGEYGSVCCFPERSVSIPPIDSRCSRYLRSSFDISTRKKSYPKT